MVRFRFLALVLVGGLGASDAGAQTFSGSVRARGESWRWFDHPVANNSYAFAGALLRLAVADQGPRMAWRIELAAPLLVGLPDDAVAPAPGGQLGGGASYWQANDSSENVAHVFLKQAFVRVGKSPAQGGHSLRLGRFEFIDGAELVPGNVSLAALKRDRIAHRLIGNFGWTHVQRSYDGLHYSYDRAGGNRTFVALRPTRGVFDANGWGGLDVALLYGSLSRGGTSHDWRVFFGSYHDYREEPRPLKADNRPVAVRAADTRDIGVQLVGAHYLRSVSTSAGAVDLLGWGTFQWGDWGTLAHRAFGFSAEAGMQPAVLPVVKPWLRVGYTRTSGDDEPTDGRHGTFFQVLPTPRIYARFPFYNLMNLEDASLSLILRPGGRLTLRGEAHHLRLTESADLWYAGGGAFEPATFGYAGRPANGARDLGTLYDLSADWRVNQYMSINAYGAVVRGGDVVGGSYRDRTARLGYIELELRR